MSNFHKEVLRRAQTNAKKSKQMKQVRSGAVKLAILTAPTQLYGANL